MIRTTMFAAILSVAASTGVFADSAPATLDAIVAQARSDIARVGAQSLAAAKTAEEKAVVAADLAFAADAKARGAAAAFAAAMHPDGKMFPPRMTIVTGPEGARALFADDTSLWEWAPVQFAASGDLGVTWGIAVISGKDKDGKLTAFTTRYVSVWRKDAAGAWKMWLDVGTPGPHAPLP